MTAMVPSLEGSLYLRDPQSIIGYTLRRYFRTPKSTIPIVDELIISLPRQVADHGRDPITLTQNMQSDLQGVFNRIFSGERSVKVTVNYETNDTAEYNVNISVMYTLISGDVTQTGATISLKNGRLVIPEDNLNSFLS